MQPLLRAEGVVEPAHGAVAGLGRWFVGGAVLLTAGALRICRRRTVTTAHRALLVCEWPALGILLATARSNALSAVYNSSGGACTGCCGWDRQLGCVWGCSVAECWSFADWEALLGNHSAQSPVSV